MPILHRAPHTVRGAYIQCSWCASRVRNALARSLRGLVGVRFLQLFFMRPSLTLTLPESMELFAKSGDYTGPMATVQRDDLGIVPGRKGSLEAVLASVLVENQRSSGAKVARAVLYAAGVVLLPLGIGLLSKSVVVPEGSVGISINDGRPELMGPGRHCLVSPFNPRHSFRTGKQRHQAMLSPAPNTHLQYR